jgi:hypothetical protein
MTMRRVFVAALCCLLLSALVTAVAVRAAVNSDEIEWISSLPGVVPINAVSGHHHLQRTYQASRAADTFNALLSELPRRGWKINKATDVEDARASVRVLTAVKGHEQLDISISTAEVAGPMTLSLSDERAPADATVHHATTGHTAVLNGNNETLAVDLDNGPYVVNGNGNHVTLRGGCSELTVNGSSNQVTVQGRLTEIQLNGHSNEVDWSAAANPTPPEVQENGHDNHVVRIR